MDCKYRGLHTEIKTDQILSDLSRNPGIQLLFDTQMWLKRFSPNVHAAPNSLHSPGFICYLADEIQIST